MKDESSRENSEELDALLYSSDDDYSDDDVTSTGHSPSALTDEVPHDPPAEEKTGESFVGPTAAKRRRTGPVLLEEDEAESCTGPRKRSRREKVQIALGALRSVVPGARGKNGISVIDEAIEYLSSPPFAYNLGQQKIPTPPQKRFLVFDRSGEKTTLFYTRPSSWVPPNNLKTYQENNTVDNNIPRGLTKEDESSRENSEELDALLYSSDDDYSDDDVTSTGHSPSALTDEVPHDPPAEEKTGESFLGPTAAKRRRTGPVLLEEDEAESCSGPRKRSRREKVQIALGALRSVVPGARGKNGISVIDEAIEYLRSLKVEMKALGLDAL
ncbi:Transcription factor bHLH145 [Striga hermonthica]|uniref:Transcription factor bHLH145 n=1 Tax=Striga hermonthica TaxID=68872 RepID=A0A9N7N9X1_STRHE|nr:Transcription factor bHLH145 [Striga hermonthica]